MYAGHPFAGAPYAASQSTGVPPAPGVSVDVLGVSTTRYGGIIAAYDVSVDVQPAEPSTRYGAPLAWTISQEVVGTIHHAYGGYSTQYGLPSAASPVGVIVQGACTTGYGSPAAAAVVAMVGGSSNQAGTPSASVIVRAKGVQGTQYGRPSLHKAHIVKGVQRTRYGRVVAARPNAHLVYGLNNGRRAGVPRAVEIP